MKRSADALSAGVQKKRQKIRSARSIASESASKSLNDGSLPVAEFVAARKFEIKALDEAIKKSREAVNKRAFQTLPRHLRRRAASHNVKRVPKRLRERARAEVAETDQGKKRKGAPYGRKRGRKQTIQKLLKLKQLTEEKATEPAHESKQIPETELPLTKPLTKGKFVNRQRDKTWLPSHLHSSKRCKMQVKWNYAIPQSPNEKTYRATHRALTTQGAIVFDTSYYGHVLLKGPAQAIADVIESLTKGRLGCGKRAQRGLRTFAVNIYLDGTYLCPATLLWDSGATEVSSSLLLSLHPVVYVSVWKLILAEKERLKLTDLKVIDMRFQIGSIVTVGPKAVDALISVLRTQGDSECAKAFRSFHGLRSEVLGLDIILSFPIADTRKEPPPRMIIEKAKQNNNYLAQDPVPLGSSGLFSLQQTEACNLEPEKCDAIPVFVYRSSIGMTLMAPWAHITHVWFALNHLQGVKLGGLDQLAQIHYEKKMPFFPHDFPGTQAGNQEAQVLRKQREQLHLRRPPAKRINHAKAINGKPEIGDPFTCDFDYLLNVPTDESLSDVSHVSVSILDKSTMDTTADITMEDVSVLPPLDTSTPQQPLDVIADSLSKSTTSQVNQASDISTKQKLVPRLVMQSERSTLTSDQVACGIMQVQVTMTKRGNPSSCARIYHTPQGPLIGFITTGNFSLSQGRAAGIGCILVSHVNAYTGKGKQGCFVRDVGQKDFYPANWCFVA